MLLKFWVSLGLLAGFVLSIETGHALELDGVVAKFEQYVGPARIEARSIKRHKLRIDIDPVSETEELDVRIELPITGRSAWPVADVEIRDVHGEPIVVRRSGIEWHKLLITVPAQPGTYFVQAIDPPRGRLNLPSEKERQITDPKSGLSLSIARWYEGRKAALSLRFDDSHPTHLSKAIPILREYGFRGTFMINPGHREPNGSRRSDFEVHQAEWEAVARRGDQEFANHSAHHRGAISDADMEAEIGEAARAIWNLSPNKSKLTALNLGGGTLWETTQTLRHYLDRYHQFDASANSTGMDDSYGNRVENFRRMLGQHLERGLWFRVHYHYIGENLSSSEANFRAALDIVKAHEDELWVAGMADIHKYQTERINSSLSLVEANDRLLMFRVTCLTNPGLYDQLMTIQVALPRSWPSDQIAVTDSQGSPIAIRKAQQDGQSPLRFNVAPLSAEYIVELRP